MTTETKTVTIQLSENTWNMLYKAAADEQQRTGKYVSVEQTIVEILDALAANQ